MAEENSTESKTSIDATDSTAYLERCQEKADYAVAMKLIKDLRPLNDGKFFKEFSVMISECYEDRFTDFSKIIGSLNVSDEYMSNLMLEIGAFVNENHLKKNMLKSKYYSICLHHMTDIESMPYILICVRTVDEHFNVIEEVGGLRAFPFYDENNITGKELFDAINEAIFEPYGVRNLSSIYIDGNAAMTETNKDFFDLLLNNNVNVPRYHCVMHHQELLTKALGMQEAMDVALNIAKRLAWTDDSSKHTQLQSFLEQIEEEDMDLPLFSMAQYLIRGKIIDGLLDLREEIVEFLPEQSSSDLEEIDLFNDPKMQLNLSFVSDMEMFINLFLQNENNSVFRLVEVLSITQHRMQSLKDQLQSEDFKYMRKTKKSIEKYTLLDRKAEFVSTVNRLMETIENILNDFKKIKELVCLFNAPLTCDIAEQDISLHDELHRMRSDILLPLSKGLDFWKELKEEDYPKSKAVIYKMYSMFGSTYFCESAFSSLRTLLSRQETVDLSELELECILRIKCCPYKIDIDELLKHRAE